jgi:hypothetical protein
MCLRRRLEAEDQLRLLAHLGGHKSYDPPAGRITELLDGLDSGDDRDGDRYARILAVADATGGEVA